MEVTAAAAQAATYTSNKSLAEQINDYLATTKTSIATLASEIPGYSRPTISRYLSGKYEGDIAAIEKLLADWLAGRTGEDVALPEPGRKTGTKPAFFESRDALKVLGVCQSCQEYIGLGIVVARSGYGKTYSLRQYAKLPRVAYIECDDTMSSRDLVEAIERALGIPSGYGTIWRRVNGIRDYFNTNKGYLLIIDEADKLVSKYTQKKMEILRAIFDQSDVGSSSPGSRSSRRRSRPTSSAWRTGSTSTSASRGLTPRRWRATSRASRSRRTRWSNSRPGPATCRRDASASSTAPSPMCPASLRRGARGSSQSRSLSKPRAS